MFGFTFESLKMDLSNPMLWAGLVLMVVAVVGYFWMTTKQETVPNQQSVSFVPAAQVIAPTDQQMCQEPPAQHYHNLEEQPTAATCIVNEAGEQVCA